MAYCPSTNGKIERLFLAIHDGEGDRQQATQVGGFSALCYSCLQLCMTKLNWLFTEFSSFLAGIGFGG